MANLGATLKQEIVRLSRKEIRSHIQPLQRMSAQYRRNIAGLKKQAAALERQIAVLQRQARNLAPAPSADEAPEKIRFVAKGLKSHRSRLGLSAADYGLLAGVSAQSVYNWESGGATPRAEQLKALAALRGIGKREANRRIEEAAAKSAPKAKKAAKSAKA